MSLEAAAKKTVKSLKNLKRRRGKRDESSDESSSDDETTTTMVAQNDEHEKTEEEMRLESLVFGAEFSEITAGISGSQQKKIRAEEKKTELADNFVERKPAWKDDDDDEK